MEKKTCYEIIDGFKNYDDDDDFYAPTKKSIKTAKMVIDVLDDAGCICKVKGGDGVYEDGVYPDGNGGIIIRYDIDETYYVDINTLHNMIILTTNVSGLFDNSSKRLIWSEDKPLTVVVTLIKYLDWAEDRAEGKDVDCIKNEYLGTVVLDIYNKGLRFMCEDFMDEFIPTGDANPLIDRLNDAKALLDPTTTYTLSDKGRAYLDELMKNELNENVSEQRKIDKVEM